MPTRTRHGYTRCPDCRRHAHAPGLPSDFRCPFCEAGRSQPLKRTRSAILAGALALAGCGATEAETPEDPAQQSPGYVEADDPAMTEAYGGAPLDEPEDNEVDDTPAPEDDPQPE